MQIIVKLAEAADDGRTMNDVGHTIAAWFGRQGKVPPAKFIVGRLFPGQKAGDPAGVIQANVLVKGGVTYYSAAAAGKEGSQGP